LLHSSVGKRLGILRGWSKVQEPGETPFPAFVEMPTINEGPFVEMGGFDEVPATQEDAPTMTEMGDSGISTDYSQL
jgi:hypothetical protein